MVKWIKENIIKPLNEIINKIDELRYSVSEQIKCLSDSKYDIIKEKTEEILSLQTQLARLEEKNAHLQQQIAFYDDLDTIDEHFSKLIDVIVNSSQQEANKCMQEKNQTLNDLCEVLTKQNEFLKNKNDTLSKICDNFSRENEITKEAMVEKEDECADLIECLNTICNGAYNADFVEFFALKTYRGWKYICHDGETITDFDNILSVNMEWTDGEKLKVTYDKIIE